MAVIAAYAPSKDVTGAGHFMETQAWLDTDNGHMEAISHIWCTNWVIGFTGSVGLVYLGTGTRPFGHHSQVSSFGVDALGVFWSRSNRTDPWSHDIDPSLAQRVEQLLIVQTHDPNNRLSYILGEISRYGDIAINFCKDNPQLCSEMGGLF